MILNNKNSKFVILNNIFQHFVFFRIILKLIIDNFKYGIMNIEIPQENRDIIRFMSAEAARLGLRLYAVGGCVRDWIMGRPVHDIDFLAGGPADGLAEAVIARYGGKWQKFGSFQTVRCLTEQAGRIDIARFRRETYSKPAALPETAPADTVEQDLLRRDFTVNAMAAELTGIDGDSVGGSGNAGIRPAEGPATAICACGVDAGDAAAVPGNSAAGNKDDQAFHAILTDIYGGESDIHAGIIRVLHKDSFRDDPTRIYRAARFAARFGWKIAPETEKLAIQAAVDGIPGLLSRERLRNELVKILSEDNAAQALEIAARLGAADYIFPGMNDMAEKFRTILAEENVPPITEEFAENVGMENIVLRRIAALAKYLADSEGEFIYSLRLSRKQKRIISELSK